MLDPVLLRTRKLLLRHQLPLLSSFTATQNLSGQQRRFTHDNLKTKGVIGNKPSRMSSLSGCSVPQSPLFAPSTSLPLAY